MTARRLAAALVAIALVGCSGSGDEPELVPDSTLDTIVSNEELLDGAFEENEGESEPGDGPSTTDADAETDPSTTVSTIGGADGDTGGSNETTTTAPSSASTTTGGGSTTGDTTTDATGGATTTGGTTTGSTTGGDTTGGATTGGTGGDSTSVGSTGEIEALTGVITIGDDTYAFPIDGCNVVNEETSATGGSTRDNIPFNVVVTSSLIDLDDDGADDRTIEINVETSPDAEGDHPDYYVVGLASTSAALSTKFEIDFSVSAERITASGPIEDLNRVAIPAGDTLPMTADLRCA